MRQTNLVTWALEKNEMAVCGTMSDSRWDGGKGYGMTKCLGWVTVGRAVTLGRIALLIRKLVG